MEKKDTKYLTPSPADLETAAAILRQGGTVIFPTETVYGLGANALSADAVKKIFAAKGRPADNPLIVHIADVTELSKLTADISPAAQKLIDAFWPGPLTLIFKKSPQIPSAVTGGLNTVAIRMPSSEIARKLLQITKLPIAAPSANLSGKPSPTSFRYVKADMDGRVDAIIDGGDCTVGVESAVLDVSGETPILFRPGKVTREQIENLIGPIKTVSHVQEGEAPKSPGLKYKHYAPNAKVLILHGSLEQVQDYINHQKNLRVGMLVFDEFPPLYGIAAKRSLGSRSKPQEAAHRLFTALRELDDEKADVILAPEIPDSGIFSAVRNRLYRAAGGVILDLTKQNQKILFVCTGNTCRSPMAEGLLRSQNSTFSVSSAGLFADGSPVSDHAVSALAELGIDISGHRSRQLTPAMAEEADLILTMTNAHRKMLEITIPQAASKTLTLSQWAGETGDVSDPFGGSQEDYNICRDQILTLIQKGLSLHP